MKKINIGLVVRTYDESGNCKEGRYDNVSCKGAPDDIMKDIINGEAIQVRLMPNVDAFYFRVPNDWPENWTQLGEQNETNHL